MPEKLEMRTKDITGENVEKIASLFPNCVVESLKDGKPVKSIDFDALRQELSDFVVDGPTERYQFTWPDKSKAKLLANSPINMTLRPCPEESVDFDNTKNLYIEGDNLDVLKLLRETYLSKIKMIYIDPPYNTGNDFVYNDDFSIDINGYAKIGGDYDENDNRLEQNSTSNGRFHTDWLNMMYPRLKLSRDLLSEDGSIFISIDDNEVNNLRKLCDEIFGEYNFIATIVWQKKYAATNDSKGFSTTHDYIVAYQKSSNYRRNLLPRSLEQNKPYKNNDDDGRGLWRSDNLLVKSFSESGVYPIINPNTGVEHYPPKGSCWRASKETMSKWLSENRIFFGKDGRGAPQLKRYLNEVQQGRVPVTWWPFEEVGHNDGANKELQQLFDMKSPFDTPKPTSLIEQILRISTDSDSIVLDYFSGSATTANAVLKLNKEDRGSRRYILVQLPEICREGSDAHKQGYKTICEVGKERIRRAGKQIQSATAQSTLDGKRDVDIGFRVLKLDSSNMKDVYYSPDQTFQSGLDSLLDNVKEDRKPQDLLFQCMLNLGIELSVPINLIKIDGKDIYDVDNGYLLACFDTDVTESVVTEIAKRKPVFAVMRDSSMDSDSTATNFEQVFKTYSPATTRKVI